jgi:hypothetical protein
VSEFVLQIRFHGGTKIHEDHEGFFGKALRVFVTS